MANDKNWWTLLYQVTQDFDLESLGAELIERGASGAETVSNDRVRCFLQADEAGLESFKQTVLDLPVKLVSSEIVPPTNWVQKCEDVWQELKIDKLSIVPVMSLEQGQQLEPATPERIYIIPGCGFGTGHHATTNQATALLQTAPLQKQNFKRALDVGTGSGLLAIVANRLFHIPVEAIDNDPDAINNANDNVILNGVQEHIKLQVTDALTWSNGEYDLVMANLYAELLEKMHATLYKATKSWLVISGFHTPDIPELNKYAEPLWERVDIRTQDNWTAMLLRKK